MTNHHEKLDAYIESMLSSVFLRCLDDSFLHSSRLYEVIQLGAVSTISSENVVTYFCLKGSSIGNHSV